MSYQKYSDAVGAVDRGDSALAYRLLKEWDGILTSFPPELANDGVIQNDLPVLKADLQYTSLAELPLAEAQKILSEDVLAYFRRNINLGDLLALRRSYVPYGTQEDDRKALKKSILSNKEVVGTVTIGEWLLLFDKMFSPEEREQGSINDFLTRESRVAGLSKADQNLLRLILTIYEEHLASERLGLIDLGILAKDPQGRSGMNRNQSLDSKNNELSGIASTVKMPLLQALSKYENLGNQLITNERIKIKSQPEPVRPSLLYWIKYYRDELGIGHHSTVDRGNFLFRSENGKRLSPEERERVNLVLKSVEENYPVDIDTEHSEIIFPAFVASAPRPQPVPQAVSQPAPVATPLPRPKPAFNFGQGGMMSGAEVKSAPKDTPAPGNLSFTSKHVFPAEKPTTPVTPAPLRPTPQTPRLAPQVSDAPQPQNNPFRIHPVSLGKVKDEE